MTTAFMNFKHTDVNLCSLVDHNYHVNAHERLSEVYDLLGYEDINFVAVLNGGRAVGF